MGVPQRANQRLAVLGIALSFSWLAGDLASHPLTAHASGPVFRNSSVTGGGFMSVLAQSVGGTLIAGGDTQGFFRSVDTGKTWTPQNAGIPTSAYHVAAILPLDTAWYAAVGDGANGGVARSLDDGLTWAVSGHAGASSPPVFDGSNLPGQMGQPRATGDLLASDGSFLYAASFGHGLQRWALSSSTLGGGWQCVALCASFLNSMALDGMGDAFVSAISRTGTSQGVYEVTGLGKRTRTIALGTQGAISRGVQELVSLGARVYVAGASGIGYWSHGLWSTLERSSHWYTLTGYEATSGGKPVDVLYAATYAGHGANDVEQLTVTGATAAVRGLVPPGSVGAALYGTATQWWEASSAGTAGQNLGPQSMIGGCPSSTSALCAASTADFYAGSSIVALTHNPGAPDILVVAGRSGVWYYDSSATPAWLPAVTGLASTFDPSVAVDPANSADVAASDVDWNVLASTDSLNDVDGAVRPPLFSPNNGIGFGVTWDASVSPSALIISGGSRATNTLGSIWYDAAWATGGAWTAVPLPTGVSSRPIAIASRALSAGVYVLLAAFQGTGVYAFTGSGASGTWTQVPSGATGAPSVSPSDTHGLSLAWASDGSAMFLYDAGTHAVWQSTFDGVAFAPWIELYADSDPTPGRGWVVGDPSAPTELWIANRHGLGFIDTTSCSSDCTPTWVVTSAGGPLATYSSANGDYVYMADGGVLPSFWEVQVTQCTVSCPVAAGFADPYYQTVAASPVALAAGTDGSVYLATLGNGIAAGITP